MCGSAVATPRVWCCNQPAQDKHSPQHTQTYTYIHTDHQTQSTGQHHNEQQLLLRCQHKRSAHPPLPCSLLSLRVVRGGRRKIYNTHYITHTHSLSLSITHYITHTYMYITHTQVYTTHTHSLYLYNTHTYIYMYITHSHKGGFILHREVLQITGYALGILQLFLHLAQLLVFFFHLLHFVL